jgi:hypothetical protein
MTRLIICAMFLGFLPTLAFGQSTKVLCGFDDELGIVVCEQESRPVFRYEISNPDTGILSRLSASADKRTLASSDRERCRTAGEGFRAEQVEGKFNAALEGLRRQAEDVRSASEGNLILYKQIMLIYDGLFGRYRNSLQAYQDFVKTCRHVTPYDVRPDKI